MKFREHYRVGILNLFRVCIQKVMNCESRDIIFHIKMMIKDVDLSYQSVDDLGLSNKRSNARSSSFGSFERVLAKMQIRSDDAIIDLGSGKGAALMIMANYPFRKIAGVEISRDLVEVAQNNLRKLELTDICVHCSDGGKFLDLDDYNYIYMFNPFPCQVVRDVISNLIDSLSRKPRQISIIYINPKCHSEIIESSIFKQVATFESADKLPFYIYGNSAVEPTKDNHL